MWKGSREVQNHSPKTCTHGCLMDNAVSILLSSHLINTIKFKCHATLKNKEGKQGTTVGVFKDYRPFQYMLSE